jgi:hypothetical protein
VGGYAVDSENCNGSLNYVSSLSQSAEKACTFTTFATKEGHHKNARKFGWTGCRIHGGFDLFLSLEVGWDRSASFCLFVTA